MTTEHNLLVLILDTSPAQKYLKNDPKTLYKVADAAITFCNAYTMLSHNNQIAFFISHINQSDVFYPLEQIPKQEAILVRQQDGQYEVFLELEYVIRKKLKKLVTAKNYTAGIMNPDRSINSASCLASSLGRALCFINRKGKEIPAGEKLNSRILVLTGSSESTAQYMSFMNVFFSAQKLGVTIDSCILDTYATLLSQGADITGGTYLRPPQINGLLEYLFWVFLPDVPVRKQLNLPTPAPVDYRAACFCHRQFMSQGFVCSVCLSIFCKFTPICTTCNAVFKTPPLPLSLIKGKKRH